MELECTEGHVECVVEADEEHDAIEDQPKGRTDDDPRRTLPPGRDRSRAGARWHPPSVAICRVDVHCVLHPIVPEPWPVHSLRVLCPTLARAHCGMASERLR